MICAWSTFRVHKSELVMLMLYFADKVTRIEHSTRTVPVAIVSAADVQQMWMDFLCVLQ